MHHHYYDIIVLWFYGSET